MSLQITLLHQICYREWERVKDDPSIRAKGFPAPEEYCMTCKRRCAKPIVCPNCEAVPYCSETCRTMNLNRREIGMNCIPGHREHCDQIKDYKKKAPAFESILAQFPWPRFDEQQIYQERITLASRSVLGQGRDRFGYWAEACKGCDEDPCPDYIVSTKTILKEKDGWKLPNDEIPWLGIGAENRSKMKIPSFPPTFELSWKGYYQWRKLPLESPAAIHLHWPMSFFMCLKELGLVEQSPVLNGPKRELRVDCVGAERELIVLPVFGELALLLPNTELIITIISSAAEQSVARKGVPSPLVFKYTAPSECGGGSVSISLDGTTQTYDPSTRPGRPDAIVALEAGLGVYRTWMPVYFYALQLGIPFAITDNNEQSANATHQSVRQIVEDISPQSSNEGWYKKLMKRKPDWKMNPFMRPGMTAGGRARIPYGTNAFLYVVNK